MIVIVEAAEHSLLTGTYGSTCNLVSILLRMLTEVDGVLLLEINLMFRAIARKVIKPNNKDIWLSFLVVLNYKTPQTVVWGKLK